MDLPGTNWMDVKVHPSMLTKKKHHSSFHRVNHHLTSPHHVAVTSVPKPQGFSWPRDTQRPAGPELSRMRGPRNWSHRTVLPIQHFKYGIKGWDLRKGRTSEWRKMDRWVWTVRNCPSTSKAPKRLSSAASGCGPLAHAAASAAPSPPMRPLDAGLEGVGGVYKCVCKRALACPHCIFLTIQ